ncbi:MAG TPA: hypothetical protein VH351_01425 [Bryobacteraceae bacterium]|nr:hypothetical protein [Bryobacteraceae bacterium]
MPAIAFPAAIALIAGGTTCLYGNCDNPDVLTPGQGGPGLANVSFTVNGDAFSLYAPFSVANNSPNGTSVSYLPIVVYTGSAPTRRTDAFTIDFYQDFSYPAPSGKYSEATGAFVWDAGPGSYFIAEAFYNGNGVGIMGPFAEGDSSDSHESALTLLGGNPLNFQYEMTYIFEPGSLHYAVMAAPGPPGKPDRTRGNSLRNSRASIVCPPRHGVAVVWWNQTAFDHPGGARPGHKYYPIHEIFTNS